MRRDSIQQQLLSFIYISVIKKTATRQERGEGGRK